MERLPWQPLSLERENNFTPDWDQLLRYVHRPTIVCTCIQNRSWVHLRRTCITLATQDALHTALLCTGACATQDALHTASWGTGICATHDALHTASLCTVIIMCWFIRCQVIINYRNSFCTLTATRLKDSFGCWFFIADCFHTFCSS